MRRSQRSAVPKNIRVICELRGLSFIHFDVGNLRMELTFALDVRSTPFISTFLAWIALLLGANFARAAEPTGELARKLAGVTFEYYAPAPGYSEGPTWVNGEV